MCGRDWSSDVCSSDLNLAETPYGIGLPGDREREEPRVNMRQSRGRTPGREGETVREIERKDRQSRRIGGKG